jgi:hypothetical protein
MPSTEVTVQGAGEIDSLCPLCQQEQSSICTVWQHRETECKVGGHGVL